MTSIVNGFVCRSSCDESVARKGRDPSNPTGDPVKQRELDLKTGKIVEGPGALDALTARPVGFGQDASTVSDGPAAVGPQPYSPALFFDQTA